MKADQARVRDLVTQTVTLMCKNGLDFSRDLRVEGLLAVTVDGTDIFVIHMDEKVTDRPSYGVGSRHAESIAGRQQRDSASGAQSHGDDILVNQLNDGLCQSTSSTVSDRSERSSDRPSHAIGSRCTENITGHHQWDSASGSLSNSDDITVNHLNDGLCQAASSAVGDKSERSSAFGVTDVHSVKTEPNVEHSDDDDDVMIVESDVKSLLSSNIPLPVVQGMNERGDDSPFHMPLSPVNKKRRMFHRNVSVGDLPASVASIADDQLDDAHLCSGSASCACNSNNVSIPLIVESDVAPHTSFISENGSQTSVSVWYWN